MMRAASLVVIVATSAGALIATHGCGPPCADDRCSLTATKPQVTRVDYTKKDGTGGGPSTVPPTGSGSPIAVGSAAVATGSAAKGSAAPVGSGSAVAVGSGSAGSAAGSAAAVPSGTSWERWDGDTFKMHVISKAAIAANTTIKFEFVKAPDKTPFVVTLEVRPPGGSPLAEGAWNDCPETKIRCDAAGTKTHATRKAGQVLLQAGVNWTVTGVTDEAKGTLVTWTNNLSREVLALRLLK